jgi:hypothetical protein
MQRVEQAVPATRPLALVGWKEQLMLQIDRPVLHFGFRRDPAQELRDAVAWLKAEPDGQILVAATRMPPCLDATRARPVAFRHRRQWMLADARALTGACEPGAPIEMPRLYDPALGRLQPP